MAKLTKAETAAHERACALLAGTAPLDLETTVKIIENWHEGAAHMNTRASAHFTPWDLARHAALEVGDCETILDLCAGIGTLAAAVFHSICWRRKPKLTLVEINPDYAAVARRLLPEAEIIVGSMYDAGMIAELASRGFDMTISNPPFGTFSRQNRQTGPRYTGAETHYHAIDIASDISDYGVFILPQQAAPFCYSGRPTYENHGGDSRYRKFAEQTSIELGPNLGIDTSVLPGFRGVTIVTEIVTADFIEARARRAAARDHDAPLLQAMAA